jgi:hypothetical protein
MQLAKVLFVLVASLAASWPSSEGSSLRSVVNDGLLAITKELLEEEQRPYPSCVPDVHDPCSSLSIGNCTWEETQGQCEPRLHIRPNFACCARRTPPPSAVRLP